MNLWQYTVISAIKEQVSCNLGGEAVILNLKNGSYYGLDVVGARIWGLIQEPKTLSEVCDAILREFDVERARCERDLWELVQNLSREGLVEVKDASVP